MALRKPISFAVVQFCVGFPVAYALTGSVLNGGTLALIGPAINSVALLCHELDWRRILEGPKTASDGWFAWLTHWQPGMTPG